MSNGLDEIKESQKEACGFGISLKVLCEERSKNYNEKLDKMELWIGKKLDKIEKRIWNFAVPSIFTLLGILFMIWRMFNK